MSIFDHFIALYGKKSARKVGKACLEVNEKALFGYKIPYINIRLKEFISRTRIQHYGRYYFIAVYSTNSQSVAKALSKIKQLSAENHFSIDEENAAGEFRILIKPTQEETGDKAAEWMYNTSKRILSTLSNVKQNTMRLEKETQKSMKLKHEIEIEDTDVEAYINKYFVDDSFNIHYPIPNRFDRIIADFQSVREVIGTIPENLTRSIVFERFKNCGKDNMDTYFEAFIYAMIWGGISCRNLRLSLGIAKESIEVIVQKVEDFMKTGEVEEAFNLLMSGENRILGVGLSFLTKILYFFGDGNNALIFDKWSQYSHFSILMDQIPEKIPLFYETNGGLFLIKGKEFQAYSDYLLRMTALSEKLHIQNAGHLEAFLFGSRIRDNSDWRTNPRAFNKTRVDDYLRHFNSEA